MSSFKVNEHAACVGTCTVKCKNLHLSRLFDLRMLSSRPGKPLRVGQTASFTGTSREASLSFCHLEK